MKYLEPSDGEILIKPRWPYKRVALSEKTHGQLLLVQKLLAPHAIRLVLTRGYEYEGAVLKRLHKLCRVLSNCLFVFVYPSRIKESSEIFCSNGHDVSGNNIDVGIVRNNTPLTLLPRGAFTSPGMIDRVKSIHAEPLELVRDALQKNGFVIHPNKTEALQIHCTLPE